MFENEKKEKQPKVISNIIEEQIKEEEWDEDFDFGANNNIIFKAR